MNLTLSRTALLALWLCACAPDGSRTPVSVAGLLTDSAGIRTLALSHSPTAIAASGAAGHVITADLVMGGGADGFGAVVDVTELPGGSIAVLDGLLHEVRIHDQSGRLAGRFGRKGDGPSDFGTPRAITAVGDTLVIWQSPHTRALRVVTARGDLAASSAAPVPGDWDRFAMRAPALVGPITRGIEDPSRRLRGLGNGFIHMLQSSEEAFLDPAVDLSVIHPEAHLIRYGLDLLVVDTVAVLAGVPLRIRDADATARISGERGRYRIAEQEMFAAAPVWTTGDGWIATGHGDSTVVVVTDTTGVDLLRVRWPDARQPITENDRFEAAKWLLAYQLLSSQAGAEAQSMTTADVREGLRVTALEWTPFARTAPYVVAAQSMGACLLLAGFSPSDSPDGVSLSWIMINVRRGDVVGTYRLQPTRRLRPDIRSDLLNRAGGVLYDVGRSAAYLVTLDGRGEHFVERFALDSAACNE